MKVNMNRKDGSKNRDPRAITLDAAFRSRSYYSSREKWPKRTWDYSLSLSLINCL